MKKLIGINGVVGIITIIYIIFLKMFSEKLLEIQRQYDNIIISAYKTANVQGFYAYFVIGIILVAVLFVEQIWNYKNQDELGTIIWLIIVLNIALLLLLIVTFANPVFTTVVILVGLGVALSQTS